MTEVAKYYFSGGPYDGQHLEVVGDAEIVSLVDCKSTMGETNAPAYDPVKIVDYRRVVAGKGTTKWYQYNYIGEK